MVITLINLKDFNKGQIKVIEKITFGYQGIYFDHF